MATSELPPCPACRSVAYGPAQAILDCNGGPAETRLCGECGLLVCTSSLKAGCADEVQREGNASYFAAPADPLEIEELRGVITFLLDHKPYLRGAAFLDFGAGRGAAAAAACDYFSTVHACDLNMDTLGRCAETWNRQNLKLVSNFEAGPRADVVMLWHVAEHLPDALGVFEKISARLAMCGYVYWQVPMYRSEYVHAQHYSFFDEKSARGLCERAGLKVQDVWHHAGLGFLTVLAKKALDSHGDS